MNGGLRVRVAGLAAVAGLAVSAAGAAGQQTERDNGGPNREARPLPEPVPVLPDGRPALPSNPGPNQPKTPSGGAFNLSKDGPSRPAPDPNPGNPAALGRTVEPDPARPPRPAPPVGTTTLFDPPSGFAGRSSVVPSVGANQDFVPVEDRWRIGYPAWDRYGSGQVAPSQNPYAPGSALNPYTQNVLKGDYPIVGQHTFLTLTGNFLSLSEARQLPTPTTPFESTARPFTEEFFGRPNQFFTSNFVTLSADLLHGDAAFKPADWRVRLTGVFNFNYLSVEELAIVDPNVLKGLTRGRTWFALQEFFAEVKLADLGPEYDFVSARFGSQPFTSDFRGFIYSDTNLMARVFGTRRGNREQFNVLYTEQFEKETFSGLNTFNDRHQNVFIANYFVQDFGFPGYTQLFSVHYNDDQPSLRYDRARFLVRPDPAGVFQTHRVQTAYLGLAGDGHIGRYNISHAFYWALGRDSLNPIANQEQFISGQMAAVELSYDRDWARFRGSFLYSSGDGNPNNSQARGFDAILPNANFAGGEFSYFQRQGVPLFGANLTNRQNLIPNLRSSQIQGQANFVNPGLFLVNAGVDFDITPKLRMINNANFLWFDKTRVLETFTFQPNIDREIGTDLSTGFEYRPLLTNNVIVVVGAATLLPASGFRAIYDRLRGEVPPLVSAFVELNLTY